MLTDDQKQQVRQRLEPVENPVTMHYVTQEFECESCQTTHELLRDLLETNENLELVTYEFKDQPEDAERLGVDKIPALVLEGPEAGTRVRFFGVPAGYEFAALLEDLIDVSRGATELSQQSRQQLETLIKPLHIQVFVTATCPHCPGAVRTAHKLALASGKISADMVSANEFPHLAQRYGVMSVPQTVVNDGEASFVGALPEDQFVAQVMQAA